MVGGDTFDSVPDSQKILFNNTKSTAANNAWTTRIEITKGRDVAELTNPNQGNFILHMKKAKQVTS